MLHLLRIAGYMWSYKVYMTLVYTCLFGATAMSLAVPRLLGNSIDAAIEGSSLQQLLWIAGLVLLVSVLRGAFGYGQQYLSEALSQRIAYQLRNRFVDRLEHLSFAFHDHQKTGDLMSKGTYDVESVRQFIQGGLFQMPRLVLMVVGIITIVLITNLQLGLISMVVVPPAIFITLRVSNRLRKIWYNIQRETGRMTTVLQEDIAGIQIVKVFGAEEHQKDKFREVAHTVSEETFRANALFVSRSAQLYLLFTGITGVILWFGGQQVLAGSLSIGQLTEFILYLGMLMMPVRMLGWMINSFARAIPSAERLFNVFDAISPVQEKANSLTLTGVKGHVGFHNVTFNYGASVPALEGISFEAAPGETIALVGPPGSGKTTIAQLIPRFYDVTEGRITIDGKDIRDVSLGSLHKAIGIVFQDIFLFSATVRDNIAYGATNATDEQVESAAKAAQLHDFIVSQPKAYQTWIGERGVSLSGGQRQRMAIARTLLLDPPILILDDSTSSVDAGTEHLIQQALDQVMKNRTTFIIAHRISSVKSADRILVMDKAHISQLGRHEDLLLQAGMYRDIYNLQFLPQESKGTDSNQKGITDA